MKIKHLPLFLSLGAIILFSGYTILYPTGAPPAKTGSPGDGSNCTECHGGSPTTTAGLITSNIPAGGYVPGTTYLITATNPLTNVGKMGFEVSPQNAAGALLGTLIAGSGSQLVGSNKYVTHTNANTTTNTWTFSWIAPAAGTGSVTFYGAFARNNPGPVTKSTLVVQEAVAAPAAAGPISGPTSVCKSNSATYSVGTIAGATSYVWTAPSGATIQSGQGTTSVTVLFGASATSGNMSVFGSNAGGNGAASNLSVTVNTVPSAPATPAGPALVDLNTTTTSDYTTSGVAVSYVWQLIPAEAGLIAGTTSAAQVTWNSSYTGNAEITVKGINDCGEGAWSQVKTTQIVNTTGISEAENVIQVLSRSNGGLDLALNTNVKQASVYVFDLSGRIILNTQVPGQGTHQIGNQLKSGVYIIMVEAGSVSMKKKVFVI